MEHSPSSAPGAHAEGLEARELHPAASPGKGWKRTRLAENFTTTPFTGKHLRRERTPARGVAPKREAEFKAVIKRNAALGKSQGSTCKGSPGFLEVFGDDYRQPHPATLFI